MSARKTDYFKLGMFVLVGTGLVLLALVFLGASSLFKETLAVETYMNESVNGLDVGSPVKFRGVKVGSVRTVGFTWSEYDVHEGTEGYRYVRVLCELDMHKFPDMSPEQLAASLENEVKKGLRMRPVSQGLTGQLYLGMDYVEPAQNPTLPVKWTPKNAYIPSAPSIMSKVESAVNSISNTLAGISKGEVEGLIHDFREVTQSISGFLKRTNAEDLSQNLVANLKETRKMFERINVLLDDPAADSIIPDTSKAVAGMRKLVEGSADDVTATVKDMRVTAENFSEASRSVNDVLSSPRVRKGLDKLPDTLNNVNEATQELKVAASRLHDAMSRVNTLVAGQENNVGVILRNMRTLMENLRDLSEDMKRYPSGVLFGAPPSQSEPTKE